MLDEHETEIACGYRTYFAQIVMALIPFGVAYYADTKWVVAAGFAQLLWFVIAYDAP